MFAMSLLWGVATLSCGESSEAEAGESAKISAWRSGMFSTVSRRALRRETVELVQDMVYGTRALPCAAFRAIWGSFLDWLEAKGETEVVATMKANYFEADLSAGWNGAIDRLIPGSYCGTQSQESWHRHKLRAALAGLKQPLEAVVRQLELLTENRLQQASIGQKGLYDAPSHQWSRTFAVTGRKILDKPDFMCKQNDGHRNQYFCMRSEVEDFEKLEILVLLFFLLQALYHWFF